MPSLILGTAGHIDHGKTALVRALTGVDTDRLKEEKERGITVDLGFAELSAHGDLHFGVVDVPGHEGFIKNMLAGATGMDLVLLVVAADEGIMPQTREHLAIVQLLGVPRLLVALAKSDLVEEEWRALVVDEVRETLLDTPYADAPIVPVSSVTGEGLGELREALSDLGSVVAKKEGDDVPRLPVDRVFTIKGAGTVVTGTLWSGNLRIGDRVRILPGDQEGRVRSLQLHGKEVEKAPAGARVAVGVTGGGVTHRTISRGQTLVTGSGWSASWMLDCYLSVLPDTGWEIEQGQRVRVHLGTAEVLSRVSVLEGDRLGPGQEGWVQLRLEEPVLARARDRLVLRSYSPVTTIAGGQVAEVLSPKRRSLKEGEGALLKARIGPHPDKALGALLEAAGWKGVNVGALPQRLGLAPARIGSATDLLLAEGLCVAVEDQLFSSSTWDLGQSRVLDALSSFHREQALKPGMPLEELRQALPKQSGQGLGEAILRKLAEAGALRVERGLARLSAFSPKLSLKQVGVRESLRTLLEGSDLAVPGLAELADSAGGTTEEVEAILRLMEAQGEVVAMEGGLFIGREALRRAGAAVVTTLGGRSGLGPADFREVLGVTRKYLLPVLRYLDVMGVTTRMGEDRIVAKVLPDGWGTSGEGNTY
jgi:selenocysteine-specific elongation factor